MKQYGIFLAAAVFAGAMLFSGCGRSSAQHETQVSDGPKDSAPDVDAPGSTTPGHASDFTPSTHPLLGIGDVPLL